MEALKAFLVGQLTAIEVVTSWPAQDRKLTGKRISIIRSGPTRSVDYIWDTMPAESRELGSESDSGGIVKEYRYDLDCLDQPLQIDLWAENEVDLEDIEAQLETALRQGQGETFAPFRDGLLLDIEDGKVDFIFEAGPELAHTGDQHVSHEWRSTMALTMAMRLSLWAVSPVQAEIILQARIGTKPASAPLTTSTTTSTGTTVEETP